MLGRQGDKNISMILCCSDLQVSNIELERPDPSRPGAFDVIPPFVTHQHQNNVKKTLSGILGIKEIMVFPYEGFESSRMNSYDALILEYSGSRTKLQIGRDLDLISEIKSTFPNKKIVAIPYTGKFSQGTYSDAGADLVLRSEHIIHIIDAYHAIPPIEYNLGGVITLSEPRGMPMDDKYYGTAVEDICALSHFFRK